MKEGGSTARGDTHYLIYTLRVVSLHELWLQVGVSRGKTLDSVQKLKFYLD